MRSFTIVAVIMALVAIVAKHSSVATHDSYTQPLHRRLNGYNYGKDEQYNMFLRRVVQQLADDEDNDKSFHATMRKRAHSVVWVKIAHHSVVGGRNCAAIGYDPSTTLSSCKSACLTMTHCTAIDYKPSTGACTYRHCTTYPPNHDSKSGWEVWAIKIDSATTTTKPTTTAVPTCGPRACCDATSCHACVIGGTTYYCHRYGGPTGYNLYTDATTCSTNPPSPRWCDYSTTCGNGAGHPGLGSGQGC